jgi:5-methylcytosine-specific restriction endonuclease McrA
VTDTPLPEPDSEELYALVGQAALRVLYGWLYRRRENPPTMAEVRLFMADALGEPQEHIDRRLRELRRHFAIPAERQDQGDPRYVLRGWAETAASRDGINISERLRAQVLAPQRCAQCGRTPIDDNVKLVIDHKVPQSWGGGNELENLQPLCEECNHGKRDYFATYDVHAEQIRQAIGYDEPQKRIGELLKAFDGGWVRTDLLGIVASAGQYQEDWQRRLRDLRFLGWDYEVRKAYNEGARVWSYYRLTKSAPWPDNIRAAITDEEKRRREVQKAAVLDRLKRLAPGSD